MSIQLNYNMLIRCYLCLLTFQFLFQSSLSSSHYNHEEEERSSSSSDESADLSNSLKCLRRDYIMNVTKSDSAGRKCWDIIHAPSCWGRCDSYEISDWRFPYVISHHAVCMHGQRVLKKVSLSNCDPGVEPELKIYEFYEAQTCSCKVCNSDDTFCDWLVYSEGTWGSVLAPDVP